MTTAKILDALPQANGDQKRQMIKNLYLTIVEEPEDTILDESEFDFVMGDGFELVAKAIQCRDATSVSIHQGLQVMKSIADETTCHWRSIGQSFRGTSGIIDMLEEHRFDPLILCDTIVLLSKLLEHRILKVNPSGILRWISLFDLIMEGVEIHFECAKLFAALCKLLTQTGLESLPIECSQRIVFSVSRGMQLHMMNENDAHHLLNQTHEPKPTSLASSRLQSPRELSSRHGVYQRSHCAPTA